MSGAAGTACVQRLKIYMYRVCISPCIELPQHSVYSRGRAGGGGLSSNTTVPCFHTYCVHAWGARRRQQVEGKQQYITPPSGYTRFLVCSDSTETSTTAVVLAQFTTRCENTCAGNGVMRTPERYSFRLQIRTPHYNMRVRFRCTAVDYMCIVLFRRCWDDDP